MNCTMFNSNSGNNNSSNPNQKCKTEKSDQLFNATQKYQTKKFNIRV